MVNYKTMEFLRFGSCNGEKIIILPGLSLLSVLQFSDAIKMAYSCLAEKYDIYLFDHIKEEYEGYDIPKMADDIIEKLNELKLNKVHIIGMSMGGMIGQEISIKAPDLVKSLIICSSVMNITTGSKHIFDNWKYLAKQKDYETLMDDFGKYVYTKSFYEKNKNAMLSLQNIVTDIDYTNFIISIDAVHKFDCRNNIKNIKCPVFVIGSKNDKVFGYNSIMSLANELKCPYYFYNEYSHAVYDEAPDFLNHIMSFICEIEI